MERNGTNKIVKFSRSSNINIGMVIFAVIFIYISICVFMYFTQKHVEGHQVEMGHLSSNNVYQGIAIRDETIVTAEKTGFVNYYAREGERVGVGNLVYTLDESGRLADYLNTQTEGTALTTRDLSELKTEILGFVNDFNPEKFSSVYDFKYSVKGTVLKLANANILDNIDAINSSGVSDLVSLCRAPETGILVYSVDGFEDMTPEQLTGENFNQQNYEKKQLIGNELIDAGSPVYKLCTSEDWSIIIQTDEEKAAELVEEKVIKVKFLKNQNSSWANVSSFTNEKGEVFVKLTFNNSMITFCTDRFIDIELILEEESGLKIPNSSIVEKEFFIVPKEYVTRGGVNGGYGVMLETYLEDGTASAEFVETSIYGETETEYYLDDMTLRAGEYILKPESTQKFAISKKGSLIGVYMINKGYADFKQINILYSNDEYSIVKSNTQYGLTVYDYIVLDASTVEEDELIVN